MFFKTQASGTGLTLVSALAPTLGIELPYWARLGGVALGMVMLVWPVLAHGWNEFRGATLTLKIFLVCCAIAVAGIWGMAWWIAPIRTVAPATVPHPAPTPMPTVKPSPAAPWVSEEEIESARKAGRILLPFKSEELGRMSYANGSENMTAYIGKWVKISAPFARLLQKTLSDKKEYAIVSLDGGWAPTLLFDPKKWQERLVRYREGTPLNAMCQLYGFAADHTLIGYNCEL
jgi:hypothetical protein